MIKETKTQQKKLEQNIQILTEEIIEKQNNNEGLAQDCTNFIIKNTEDLLSIEEFLNIKSKQYNCPTIFEVLGRYYSEKGFFIESNIIKTQSKLIKNKELETIENFNKEKEDYQSQIFFFKNKINTLEAKNFVLISNEKQDFELEKEIEKNKKQLEDLSMKFEKFKENNQKKMENFEVWQENCRKHVLCKDLEKLNFDSKILEIFLNNFIDKVSLNELKALESTILRYYEKVKSRNENIIKNKESNIQQKMAEISNIENILNKKA